MHFQGYSPVSPRATQLLFPQPRGKSRSSPRYFQTFMARPALLQWVLMRVQARPSVARLRVQCLSRASRLPGRASRMPHRHQHRRLSHSNSPCFRLNHRCRRRRRPPQTHSFRALKHRLSHPHHDHRLVRRHRALQPSRHSRPCVSLKINDGLSSVFHLTVAALRCVKR